MPTPDKVQLQKAITAITARVRKYRDAGLGEQDTKASLIEPLLEALGWDVRDPEQVRREYRTDSKDNPVDYSLHLVRKPRLLVEAKGLGESLSDRKWIGQILGYATVAGVVWCVLTDGDEYQIYNASAPVDASEKLLCHIRLSEEPSDEVARILGLISRGNMEENLLETLWNTQFVDRKVRAVLQEMFQKPADGVVRLIRVKEPKLSPKQVLDSIRRLVVRIEPPPLHFKPARSTSQPPAHPRTAVRRVKRVAKGQKQYGVGLSQLIAAGFLASPLRLYRRYKGRVLEANLLPDGQVEFAGEVYKTCSTAAEYARSVVTGRKMNTNGWVFWQYDTSPGKTMTLEQVRSAYLSSGGVPAGG